MLFVEPKHLILFIAYTKHIKLVIDCQIQWVVSWLLIIIDVAFAKITSPLFILCSLLFESRLHIWLISLDCWFTSINAIPLLESVPIMSGSFISLVIELHTSHALLVKICKPSFAALTLSSWWNLPLLLLFLHCLHPYWLCFSIINDLILLIWNRQALFRY